MYQDDRWNSQLRRMAQPEHKGLPGGFVAGSVDVRNLTLSKSSSQEWRRGRKSRSREGAASGSKISSDP